MGSPLSILLHSYVASAKKVCNCFLTKKVNETCCFRPAKTKKEEVIKLTGILINNLVDYGIISMIWRLVGWIIGFLVML